MFCGCFRSRDNIDANSYYKKIKQNKPNRDPNVIQPNNTRYAEQ